MTDVTTAWRELSATGFYVVVHDVAPRFASEIESILDAIRPLVGTRAAAAVVPCWHGDKLTDGRDSFWETVAESFEEVLLHGFHHRNDELVTWLSLLTGRADEFSRLTEIECSERLEAGLTRLECVSRKRPIGFLPPAWRRGQVTPAVLSRHWLRFEVGMHSLEIDGQHSVPLATWSWDCGRIGWLGHLSERYGTLRAWLRPLALPTIAIHPADVRRGFLPRAVMICQRMLRQGRRPVLVGEIEQRLLGEARR